MRFVNRTGAQRTPQRRYLRAIRSGQRTPEQVYSARDILNSLDTTHTHGQNQFSNNQNRRFQVYIYSKPQLNLIGYDATLQGGIFNRKSPYTIPSSEVERFVGQHNFGLIVQTKTLYFEYTTTDITKEFSSGTSASWGGIKVGFTF